MLKQILFNIFIIACLIMWNLCGFKVNKKKNPAIATTNLAEGVEGGFRFCGGPGALEAYGPNKICCKKKVFERADEHKRKRDCCSSMLYYTDVYDCVDGRLQSVNPPDPLPPVATRPRKTKPKVYRRRAAPKRAE